MIGIERNQQTRLVDAHFPNVETLCGAVAAWDLDFRPLGNVPGRDIGYLAQFATKGIDHGYARFHVPLDQYGAPPPGKITFTILGPKTQFLWWRGHQVDNRQVLVFDRDVVLASQSGSDFETHVVSFEPALLHQFCEDWEIKVPKVATHGETFSPAPAILHKCRRTLDNLRSGAGFQSDYHAVIEDLILAWSDHGTSRPSRQRTLKEGNKDKALRRCIAVIEDTDAADLSAKLLRDVAGVSARTLEYAFRDRFGLGPAALVKARRLRQARELLKAGRAHSVSNVMDTTGFWHVGQFAKDYCLAFGELPSDTLRQFE